MSLRWPGLLAAAVLLVALPPGIVAEAGGNGGAAEASTGPSPRSLYILYCAGCHGITGMGDGGSEVPPLPPHVGAFMHDPEGRRYLPNIGGVVSSGLNDHETAQVLNYVLQTWGSTSLPDDFVPFDAAEITEQRRRQREGDIVALRRAIVERLHARGIETPDYPWP